MGTLAAASAAIAALGPSRVDDAPVLLAIALLLLLLFARQVLTASDGTAHSHHVAVLDVGIVPLAIVAAAIVLERVSRVLV